MDDARPIGRFSRAQRIRKRSEFREIQARSQRIVLTHFVLLLRRPETDAATGERAARLGVTASRKIGGAVVRNRAKRLVREAFRATRSVWPTGTDLIVIVRRFDSGMQLKDVVAEWQRAAPQVRRCLLRPNAQSVSPAAPPAAGSVAFAEVSRATRTPGT